MIRSPKSHVNDTWEQDLGLWSLLWYRLLGIKSVLISKWRNVSHGQERRGKVAEKSPLNSSIAVFTQCWIMKDGWFSSLWNIPLFHLKVTTSKNPGLSLITRFPKRANITDFYVDYVFKNMSVPLNRLLRLLCPVCMCVWLRGQYICYGLWVEKCASEWLKENMTKKKMEEYGEGVILSQ